MNKPISFNATFSSRIILSKNSCHFVKVENFAKRSHKCDYCLSLTQDSELKISVKSVKFIEKYDHIDAKLSICRRLMRVLFAKTDAPLQFAKQIGWQECICRCVPFYSS